MAAACATLLACQACQGPAAQPPKPETERAPEATRQLRERSFPRFERIGRDIYLYRMRWGRADETVDILRLLLEQQTGREVIVVPHEETNSILFRVLPRHLEQNRRAPVPVRSKPGKAVR